MLEHALSEAQPLLARWGAIAVFASVFVEGLGIPAPGQTLLVAGALLASRGEASLAGVLAAAFAGSSLGPLAGWAIGRYGGRRLLARLGGSRLERLEALFARWGGALVGFGRFVDGLRQVSGIAAGALGLPFATAAAWSFAGALAWVATWGLGAFYLGQDVHGVAAAFHRVRPPALLATAAVVALLLAWIASGRRRRPGSPRRAPREARDGGSLDRRPGPP